MELLRNFWQKGCLSELIQYRKQLLSCSQSSSSSLITEIENIFCSHIVIRFDITLQPRNVFTFIHLNFSVSQTFALHYKARCVSIIGLVEGEIAEEQRLARYQVSISPLPSPGNTGPRHTWTEQQGTKINEVGKHHGYLGLGMGLLGKYSWHWNRKLSFRDRLAF